jgi:hypothetical protein
MIFINLIFNNILDKIFSTKRTVVRFLEFHIHPKLYVISNFMNPHSYKKLKTKHVGINTI